MKWGKKLSERQTEATSAAKIDVSIQRTSSRHDRRHWGARANRNYWQHSNWAAHGGKSHNRERLERKQEQLLTKNRELFKEHSLNGHDNASDGDVWREAFANYGELVKNGSEPGFVGSDECRQHWNTAVFQQRARNNW